VKFDAPLLSLCVDANLVHERHSKPARVQKPQAIRCNRSVGADSAECRSARPVAIRTPEEFWRLQQNELPLGVAEEWLRFRAAAAGARNPTRAAERAL